MLTLKPHARASNVIEALDSAARTAGNVLAGNDNAPDRILDAYRRWISTEIVDRAASLRPFVPEVHLVSYDAGIVFRAR